LQSAILATADFLFFYRSFRQNEDECRGYSHRVFRLRRYILKRLCRRPTAAVASTSVRLFDSCSSRSRSRRH